MERERNTAEEAQAKREENDSQTSEQAARALFDDLLAGCIFEAVMEVHRDAMLGREARTGGKRRAEEEAAFDRSVTAQRPASTAGAPLVNTGPDPGPSAAVPAPPSMRPFPGGWFKGQRVDIYGQIVPTVPHDQVTCPVCSRRVAAGRFSTHLEKCMRGRAAGRAASRRLTEPD